ncbi:MAG: SDR family NAD(P)-dependent oxidoreductase [Pseudomonadota bacterium]
MLNHQLDTLLPDSLANLRGKKAVITGASAGIGLATAVQLANEGMDLYLLARREDRLKEIQSSLRDLFPEINIVLICGSVTDPNTVIALEKAGALKSSVLINNAGLARGADSIEKASLGDWDEMVETNISAAFRITKAILPHMLAHGEGHIIQLSSVAGHYAYEGGSVYCATKHALLAFTKALRLETCGKGIRVTAISPGLVETEFSEVRFRGDRDRAKNVYQGLTPLTARDIASQIVWALKQPRHVNIDEILIMPDAQGSPTKIVRNL